MAVARFIIASIAIALVAAQANLDCANPQAPGNNMNYYVPSQECRGANADVEACYTLWGLCTANATNCGAINNCLRAVLVCLDNVPAPKMVNTSSPCNAWNESFANVKMYLDMGGAYQGSGLQAACTYAACTYASTVPKGGNVCPVETSVCDAPKPPAKFFLTLGGNWGSIFTTKAAEIETAVQKGIASLLGLPVWIIRVLSIELGSLVVSFAILDPNVDGAAVANTLQGAVGNSATLAAAFSELQTVAGFPITLESVAAAPDSGVTLAPVTPAGTPAATPTGTPAATPTPTPATPSSSASTVSAVAAVALVAMSLLF